MLNMFFNPPDLTVEQKTRDYTMATTGIALPLTMIGIWLHSRRYAKIRGRFLNAEAVVTNLKRERW